MVIAFKMRRVAEVDIIIMVAVSCCALCLCIWTDIGHEILREIILKQYFGGSLLGRGTGTGKKAANKRQRRSTGHPAIHDRSMLEVAVIGAGTSGLVAARHLIHAGLRPTIFEVAKTVGGAWTPSTLTTTPASSACSPASQTPSSHSKDKDGHVLTIDPSSSNNRHHPASKMWKGLCTNLSKYTCRFSDWPWAEDASTFPTIEEMHDYLEGYAENFLFESSSSCDFLMECKVFNVEQLMGSPASMNSNYKVEWTDLNTQRTHSREFGGVVVATGFFHAPQWPTFLKDRINCRKNDILMHSADYRTHHSLRNKNVAVIGSSFSALEIASDVTRSAARVVNVIPSIPWVLPRWIPTTVRSSENAHITILPVDLVLYKRHQAYPQIPEKTMLTPKDCRDRHLFLQSLVGHKQSHSKLGEPRHFDEPPLVSISDEYLDLVRDDKVEVVHGRLAGLDDDGTLRIRGSESDVDDDSPSMPLGNFDHVICCTGYAPQLHDFLSPDILSKLEYNPDDNFSPLTLAWDTLHPSLPNLAFCGMYRGPYMGIMELQARLAAGLIGGKISLQEDQIYSAIKASKIVRSTLPHAQFPHFDYPGFMDTLSQLCNSGDYPRYNINAGEAVVPSFFQSDDYLSIKCQSEIEEEIQRGQDGSRMPKLVLKSILGKWSFDRQIVYLQSRKTERVYGTVKFSKYWDCLSPDDGVELPRVVNSEAYPVRYREDGWYEMTPTQKFEVFREYEYECKNDMLEIYFVEGGEKTYLFLSLKFVPKKMSKLSPSHDDGFWVEATSDHLCIKDLYSATFRVKLNGISASEIIIEYRVKGPNKDYESTTILKPQPS